MISHKHRCVFVHIPKCGGQSIERVFVDELGLTWQAKAPLLLQANDQPNIGPPRLAHLAAAEFVQHGYLSQEIFDAYYKFTIVRHPYARAASLYRYLGYYQAVSFSGFVHNHLDPMLRDRSRDFWFCRPQTDFIYDHNDRLLVDSVLHLEDIDSAVATLFARLKIARDRLPHANRTSDTRLVSRLRMAVTLLQRGMLPLPVLVDSQVRYTDDVRATLDRLYARDFRLLLFSDPPSPTS